MNKQIRYFYTIAITITITIIIVIAISVIFTYSIDVYAQNQNTSTFDKIDQNKTNISLTYKFNPVPFNAIPLVVVNYTQGQYKFGADFSIDFGDETIIEQDISATTVPNMQLDIDDPNLYLELQCDSNDICDISLAPDSVSIYLIDNSIQDIQVAENSFPVLELKNNDCGIQSIKDCANFDFSIPNNIILDSYKIVVEMFFDEAKWIFINPIEIVDCNIK